MTEQKREEHDFFQLRQMVVRRLNEFEARLALLEARSREEEAVNFDGLSKVQSPDRRTRGRKANLPLGELTARRDRIIWLLEPHSPEIISGLSTARNAAEAANGIEVLTRDLQVKPGFLQEPQGFAAALWSFLDSGRFYGNLRNLANAMAGVPEMSWKRSFDLCTAHPPNPPIPMHHRAYRDFLHRNFPERLRELEAADTPKAVATILSKSRSKDPTYLALRAAPEAVTKWLAEGRPRSV